MCKVIVIITTYNLEGYIAQALESVLNQKTSFQYKVIVADDCSSDKTIDIVNSYVALYPNIITLFTSNKNNGSLSNSNRVFDSLNCTYFSFLDGDDYWIDDTRLQKQVEFLDNHKDYTLCGGNTRYLRDGQLAELVIHPSKLNKTYTFNSYAKGNAPFVHTSSLLVRNCIFCNGLPGCFKDAEKSFENCALRGEDFRRIIHLEKGKMYIMKDLFSIYRIHNKGMWQGKTHSERYIETCITQNYYKKYYSNSIYQKDFFKTFKKTLFSCGILLIKQYLLKKEMLNDDYKEKLELLIKDIKCNNKINVLYIPIMIYRKLVAIKVNIGVNI